MLDYPYDGSQITMTRKTTPIEAVRVASLTESYLPWCSMFGPGDVLENDNHILQCVAMGVPLCTSTAIDEAIHDTLVRASMWMVLHLPAYMHI